VQHPCERPRCVCATGKSFWQKVSDRVEKHVPKRDKKRNRRGKVYRLHGNSA
jgi:hypothetical protein